MSTDKIIKAAQERSAARKVRPAQPGIAASNKRLAAVKAALHPAQFVEENSLPTLALPWQVAVDLFRLQIISRLLRQDGMSLTEAVAKQSAALHAYDPDLHKLLDKLIIDLRALAPSLDEASLENRLLAILRKTPDLLISQLKNAAGLHAMHPDDLLKIIERMEKSGRMISECHDGIVSYWTYRAADQV